MKRALKILGILVLLLVIIIAGAAAYVNFNGIPTYEVEEVKLKVEPTPELVAQGEKLSSMLCNSCHYSDETGKLTGKRMTDAPPDFGVIYSQNITQDKEKGIGHWTDGEIAWFIRTGIRPDGQYVPPYMPKLVNLSDSDLKAIIAFLRSDHRLVQPDKTEPPPSEPSFLTQLGPPYPKNPKIQQFQMLKPL